MNALLKQEETDDSGPEDDEEVTEEWNGVEEVPPVDHEAEYIDEGKYTTVTVEVMDLSKDGLQKMEQQGRKEEDDAGVKTVDDGRIETEVKDTMKSKKRTWTKDRPRDRIDKPKKKKKKFRYESKAERKFTRMKQGARNSKEAKARREG